MTVEGLSLVPRWSPGGDSLVFVNYGNSQTGDMYWVPASGGEEARPLWSSSTLDLPQSFSPDGSRLLFSAVEGGNADLHILELGGTPEATPYLQANWAERNGRISPDGRWAAYESDEDGSFEVYVRAFPRASGKTEVSGGGGQHPRWSPDGGRLYYWRGDTLMAATVQTEPPFRVLSRSRVLVEDQYDNAGGYDVRPDGSGFVILGRGGDEEDDLEEGAAPSGLVGVVNWFEELRRRAGGEDGSRPR